jgi:hypothetical protein
MDLSSDFPDQYGKLRPVSDGEVPNATFGTIVALDDSFDQRLSADNP